MSDSANSDAQRSTVPHDSSPYALGIANPHHK